MMQKYLLEEVDFKFDIKRNNSFHSFWTRRSSDLHLPRMCTNWGKQTFIFQASKDWNNLDDDIKNIKDIILPLKGKAQKFVKNVYLIVEVFLNQFYIVISIFYFFR